MLDCIINATMIYFDPGKFRTVVTRVRKGPRKGRKRFQVIDVEPSKFHEPITFEMKPNEETGFAQN